MDADELPTLQYIMRTRIITTLALLAGTALAYAQQNAPQQPSSQQLSSPQDQACGTTQKIDFLGPYAEFTQTTGPNGNANNALVLETGVECAQCPGTTIRCTRTAGGMGLGPGAKVDSKTLPNGDIEWTISMPNGGWVEVVCASC